MKLIKKIISSAKNLKALAYTSLGLTLFTSTSAYAADAETLGTKATKLMKELGVFGQFIVVGAALYGVFLVATGLGKLKAASDAQGQVKYSEGLWRLGIGAALLGITTLTGSLGATLGLTSDVTLSGADTNASW